MADAPDGGGLREHVRGYRVSAGDGRGVRVQAGGGEVRHGAADDAGDAYGAHAASDGDREVESVPGGALRGGDQRPRQGAFVRRGCVLGVLGVRFLLRGRM